MTALLVNVADPHTGTKAGLMPPEFEMIGGNVIKANRYQLAAWESWLDFWAIVKARRKRGVKVWGTFDGDMMDMELFNSHGGTNTLSANQADAIRCFGIVMQPALDVLDRWWLVGGTEVHVGRAFLLEELAAQQMGAEKDTDGNCYAWSWLPLECQGVRFDIAHHPATSGSRPWTKHAAVARESQIIAAAYLDRGELPPDIAIRAHSHYLGDSGSVVRPRVLFSPSWALPNNFTRKIAASEIREMGGWIIECENGRAQPEYVRYMPKRREPWRES